MHDILVKIIEQKKKDLEEQKEKVSLEELKKKVLTGTEENLFLNNIVNAEVMALIAEIKLASPTNPSLGAKEEILDRAAVYEKAGADAISFITEKHYFNGNIEFIKKIKNTIKLPVLQKDFVIDPYQICEAKSIGS